MNAKNSSGVTTNAVQSTRGIQKPREEKQKSGTQSLPVMAKIAQPTLDDKHRFLLDGKTDKVRHLMCITVKFYPDNLQEVTFNVEDEDGVVTCMSTSEFQSYRSSNARKVEKEEGVKAAKGFVSKIEKRTLIKILDDSLEQIRAVQSAGLPRPVEKMMSLTQEQFKTKGFSEPGGVLKHWASMPREVAEVMDSWQQEVNPGAEAWTETVLKALKTFNDAAVATAEKKAKRLNVPPPPKKEEVAPIKDESWADANETDESDAKRKEEERTKEKIRSPPPLPKKPEPDQTPKQGMVAKATEAAFRAVIGKPKGKPNAEEESESGSTAAADQKVVEPPGPKA